MAEAFKTAASEPVWAIVILSETEAVTPLVIVVPPEVGGPPRLVHLVKGNPEDEIGTG